MLMFHRRCIIWGLIWMGFSGVCQEGYQYISMGVGSSVFTLDHWVLSTSYVASLANGDSWEYGFNWINKKDLDLNDSRIRSAFGYHGAFDLRLDSKNKKHQSLTINTNYNRPFHRWKNAFLISHYGLGLGVSRFHLTLEGDQLDVSSLQFGPSLGASYQQFLANRLCVFIRFNIGVYWRIKLPPFYPTSLQVGFKVPI